MIADLPVDSLQAGLIFNVSHVVPGVHWTSEQSPLTSDFKIRSAQDPTGYTKATHDGKNNGQAMRGSMRTEWIKSQNLEMQGPRLRSRGRFQKVLRTSLCPQDKVFSNRFHYKIKRQGSKFDKCKVRLVAKGQHMKRKNADGVGDYDDAFSPVPAASSFRTILSLAIQLDILINKMIITYIH